MKKIITLSLIAIFALSASAVETELKQNYNQPNNKQVAGEKREIKNLAEYFKYLPKEVHRNWIPYKSSTGYQVTVQFRVHRDGSISDLEIVQSGNVNANTSVKNAVTMGAPYQPLPKSYPSESVMAQVILEYQK